MIYLFENFTVLRWAFSNFSILQLDRGKEFYRYREFLEHDNCSAILWFIEEFRMV